MDTAYRIKTRVIKTILYLALILLALICLIPFWMMLVNATRSGNEIMTGFSLLPSTSLAENWTLVTENLNIFQGMLNSLVIAVGSTLLVSYFSALTAYALACYDFKGNKLLFTVMLVFMMVPAQLGLLGFYDLCNMLGLIDSYLPLILPAIASPGTVFFLRQYILSVLPKALLEAPRIDGASELRIFHSIVLPIMAPGIATMAIGAFIGSWNNYLTPLVLINDQSLFTLPMMIASLNSVKDISSNIGATYLAIAMSVVPIIVVFCFCSRYIISSISAGSVKE